MNAPWFQSFFLAFALCEWCIAFSFAPTLAAADTTAPQLLSIGSLDSSMAGVCFDEALNPATATNPLNYVINNGDVSVTSVTLRPDGKSVVLFLSGFFTTLSVTVNNVRDVAGNVIAPDSTVTGSIWAYNVDVGFPTLFGSSYSCRTGDVDMLAGGADIGGTADQFYFIYQYWQGDFDMQVKVQRLDPTDSFAKAGLLARDSLDESSRTIQAFTTPASAPAAGLLQATRRSIDAGGTSQWGTNVPSKLPNAWLRLRRQGNTFTAFYGTNGLNWVQFGQVTQSMFNGLFIGMAATSRNNNQRTTAEFRNFTFGSPPLISVHPQSQTVSPGATVILDVSANGLTPIQYQWRLNGVNIPGANSSTYTISNAQPTNGGRYTVVVVDALGTLEQSNPADVIVIAPLIPFSDTFGSGSAVITGNSGVGRGTNTNATKQRGEPDHAGNAGGKSVWVSWRATFDGFVRFGTRGSGFDTLLAAYTGTNVVALTRVTSDDDSDGFGTSSILFTTQSDRLYWIAIDGRAAASGNIVLSWKFEFGQPVPEIAAAPTNRAVPLGGSTTFRVAATNATEFQWYLNGTLIPGAAASNLTVSGITLNDVGAYTVEVGNSGSQIARTPPAYLEIGTLASRTSEDKFEDLFSGGSPPGFAAISSSTPFPVAAGTLDSQILNNNNSTTQQGETDHCGTLSSATRWFALQASNNTGGLTFVIDTAGSAINTVLAVYTGTTIFNLTNSACARGPGSASSVQFLANALTTYSVAVDGVNSEQGTIRLNWKLGRAPTIMIQPTNQFAIPGANVTFVCQAAGVPAPKFQWRSNDVNIANATNSTLVLNNVRSNHAANYSVIVSNFMGVVPSASARLTVAYPYTMGFQRITTNSMAALRLLLPPNPLATNIYVIQGTTNFSNWTSLRTNQMPTMLTNFVDPARTNFPYRFYRLMPLEP
jgi:hypothetical protein